MSAIFAHYLHNSWGKPLARCEPALPGAKCIATNHRDTVRWLLQPDTQGFHFCYPPETPCSGFSVGSGSENPEYQVGIDIGYEKGIYEGHVSKLHALVVVVTAENIRTRGNKPVISLHGFFNTNVWGS